MHRQNFGNIAFRNWWSSTLRFIFLPEKMSIFHNFWNIACVETLRGVTHNSLCLEEIKTVVSCNTLIRLFFSASLCKLASNRIGTRNPVYRHSVPHFQPHINRLPLNYDVAYSVAEINAALCIRSKPMTMVYYDVNATGYYNDTGYRGKRVWRGSTTRLFDKGLLLEPMLAIYNTTRTKQENIGRFSYIDWLIDNCIKR